MTKALTLILTLIFAASTVNAQTNGGQPVERQGGDWLSGHWGGHVICSDGRAWAIFHHIRSDGRSAESDYYFFGSSRGTAQVDVFSTDTVLIFDPRDSTVYGWQYTREGNALVGTSRGIDCRSRLAAISEKEFRYGTGTAR
ncbi:hypothetical protein [Maliponia aquimaris]|uniref:Uncharacterized protein n=1 Tax=Maliponia aquimaris TaxID=1673631 RepID=A0A238K1M7_9RHOB|nr:hypothetical protein [Maliponia aquimaris]SMX36785.1 hypothetical protein MAA8898_01043 [Maliponia aquimaris]